MSRYDIILILEVVDVSGASVDVLLKELNRWFYCLSVHTKILHADLFIMHDSFYCPAPQRQHWASLHSEDQCPPGKEQIQGAVLISLQVKSNCFYETVFAFLAWNRQKYLRNCTKICPCPTHRDDVVDLIDCYQYEDAQVNDLDAFAREPYILHFRPHNTGWSLLSATWSKC